MYFFEKIKKLFLSLNKNSFKQPSLNKPKILFLCKKRVDSYGISYGLLNSANFVINYLNKIGIAAELITCIDANEIDKYVTQKNPTIVIIEALWVTPEKIYELMNIGRHRNRSWIIRIHSKVSFLANEGIAIKWLMGYSKLSRNFKNFYIAPNTEEITNDLREHFNLNTLYLPNIYEPMTEVNKRIIVKKREEVHMGCFGAIRPMKNQLIQAIAAIKFADRNNLKLYFHMNGNRNEQNGDNIQKNIIHLFRHHPKHTLIQHNWLSHSDFLELIKEMDYGLQVSLNESFNIVCADFVYVGIPIVTSEIDWMPKLCNVMPSSSESIYHGLERIKKNYQYAINESKKSLDNYNKLAKNQWSTVINKL